MHKLHLDHHLLTRQQVVELLSIKGLLQVYSRAGCVGLELVTCCAFHPVIHLFGMLLLSPNARTSSALRADAR
jgi:hypothetical protein